MKTNRKLWSQLYPTKKKFLSVIDTLQFRKLILFPQVETRDYCEQSRIHYVEDDTEFEVQRRKRNE